LTGNAADANVSLPGGRIRAVSTIIRNRACLSFDDVRHLPLRRMRPRKGKKNDIVFPYFSGLLGRACRRAADPTTGARWDADYQTPRFVFNDADHARRLSLVVSGVRKPITSLSADPTQARLEERVAPRLESSERVRFRPPPAMPRSRVFQMLLLPGEEFSAARKLYCGYQSFTHPLLRIFSAGRVCATPMISQLRTAP